MKKLSVFLCVALLLCCMMSGCSDKNLEAMSSYSFSLAEVPVADAKSLELSDTGVISINFDVPEKGFIKMIAYDNTEYMVWPDEIAELYADFKDENGKILYDNIRISDGYFEKYSFEAGMVTVDITIENKPAKMECIALSWAFAADNYEPVAVDYETKSVAVADENGIARFSFTVENDSLVRIFPAEACIFESDCSFYVETKDGERVTGDMSIHGTEWSSRLAFLTKGDYVAVVSGIEAVAECRVREEKSYNDIQLADAEGLTVPVTFGFNALNSGERTATFTADGSKYLAVTAIGANTYYDSVQTYSIVITDAEGNVVIESGDENDTDETRFDISEFSGEYIVTVSASDCVIEIKTLSE